MASSTKTYSYDVALSYAGEDRIYAEALAEALKRRGVIVFYDKYEVATLWGQDLYTYLSDIYENKAHYCVMFLSKHYVAKLWTKHEREAAQARAFKEQEVYILPIRLDDTTIPGFLPTIAYLNWHEVTAESIADTIITKLIRMPQKTKEQWLDEGNTYSSSKRYNEALIVYEQAIDLDHNYVTAYDRKGWALYRLNHYKEALDVFEQAIALDPSYISAFDGKGWAFYRLKRYEEALAIFEQIMALDPSYISAYDGKGWTLYRLRRYSKALATFEQAIAVDPYYVSLYDGKGWTFYRLHRYKESLTTFEQFINLDSNNATAFDGKGWTLYRLMRYNEALAAFERAIELDPDKASAYDGKNSVLENLKSTK